MNSPSVRSASILVAAIVVLLSGLGAAAAAAPTGPARPADQPRSSLTVRFGYFSPFGDWTAHRYAPGVDLFTGGTSLGGELEIGLVGIHAGLYFDYTRLRTDDWEDYAASQGDDVSTSASMGDYGVRFKYYFVSTRANEANLSLALGGYFLRGNESFAGRSYDLDFLENGFAMGLGCGYRRHLNPQLAVALEVRLVFLIEAVKYADGETFDAQGVPVTAGLTYMF